MKPGKIRDINRWVFTSNDPLKNLIFSDEVDLSPLTKAKIRERREVVSCIFEDGVVWKAPRIAEMCKENYPVVTELVFRACTFKKPINWARCLFIRPIVFFACHFERYADFTRSCFYGACFQDCTFHEKVFFEDAAFLPATAAASVHCHNFCADLIERNSQCGQSACSENVRSPTERTHCANFRSTVFRDGVEFDWVRFDVPACFYKAEFHGATTFLQSGFGFPRTYESEPTSLNCSYAEIFGSIEFHQGLRWIGPWCWNPASGDWKSQVRPPPIPRPEGGEIGDQKIRADMRYVHVHERRGLLFHSENLEKCFVLGTNLEACHFTNVRWPMVDSYFPLQFKTSWTLFKYLFGVLNTPGIRVVWCAGYGNARDLFCILLIGPILLVQSFIATAVRILFRWMVRHDKPGNRSVSGQTDSPEAPLRTLSEYLVSCASHEQHGIFDHKEQIREQEESFPKGHLSNLWRLPHFGPPRDLYSMIKRWRDKWTKLSRAYRDLKAAYEANHDYIYASDFHFAEKELRRINHEVPRHTRFQLQLYWLVSGYGERVLRPIWWFLAIWVLGALPYYLWGSPLENEKVLVPVQTTAKAKCEPQLRQCDRATQTEGSEGGVSRPEQAVESSP